LFDSFAVTAANYLLTNT